MSKDAKKDCETLRTAAHITPEQAIEATLGPREQPPYDELIEALRRDWDIEASWDGLRRFWYVGLTDEGVRKRDEREATLGRGVCTPVTKGNTTTCSVCGSDCIVKSWTELRGWGGELVHMQAELWPYCPQCGAKLMEVE